MDWWLLTYFIGAILSLFLPEVPAVFQLFLLFCLAIGFLCHKRLRSSSGLCFGALWILSQAYLYHNQLPKTFLHLMQNKQAFVIEGEVLSIQAKSIRALDNKRLNKKLLSEHNLTEKPAGRATKKKYGVTKRFNFLVSKINQQPLDRPIIIRLSWQKSTFEVAQGQQLLLNVKLKPPHGLANIGTFNYLTWLKAKNIIATGYVVNPRKNKTQQQKAKPKHNQSNNVKQPKNLKQANKATKNLTANKLLTAKRSFRQVLLEQYQALMPDHTLSPILLALTFGERSLLSAEHWQLLQATGTSHLIAISGLHVGLLASSAFFIVLFIFKYLPLQDRRWQQGNIRYLAIAVSLLLATIYAYLAGFSLPTQRALVMLNLYWFSRLVGIKFSPKRLLLLTLFVLLIISPFSLLTASFWLSFYAVAIIFVTLWRFKAWLYNGSTLWRFVKGLFIIQISLTVMLMSVTALFFQQISLVSLFANVIAVPWMSVFSIPTALLSVLLMPLNDVVAQWFMMLSLQSLTWLWTYLEYLNGLPNAIVSLSLTEQLMIVTVGIVAFVMLYLSSFFLGQGSEKRTFSILPLNLGLASSAVLVIILSMTLRLNVNNDMPDSPRLSLPLAKTNDQHKAEKTNTWDVISQKNNNVRPWEIVFFDVGHGLSLLIRQDNRALLYDTGAAYPSGFKLSEAVILPYLQYSAMTRLDKVILSHSDNDHAGGINSLIDNIEINEIISNDKSIAKQTSSYLPLSALPLSNPSLSNTTLKNIPVSDCAPSQSFLWQGLSFRILWPLAIKSAEDKADNDKQKNDDSCVILISDAQGNKLLLTGDISAKVEQKLLAIYPQLKVDILQVPHHGSKTSSSQEFLRQLSPSIAVVSAGYLNRWHMPVAAVSERYAEGNIQLLNSANLGQIIISIDGQNIRVQSYVQDLRPFWFSH